MNELLLQNDIVEEIPPTSPGETTSTTRCTFSCHGPLAQQITQREIATETNKTVKVLHHSM